jgi:hypothetical protein
MPYQFSDAILQTLDREVGGYYLTSAPYEEAIATWKGIPIVYAKEHPDPKLFAKDPKKALEKIGGKIVGEVLNAWMEKTGHPRAMAQFGFSDEFPDVLKLKEEGKLSHSTSFFAMMKGKNLSGEITPNHVLVFEETSKDLPKDAGAFILNKAEGIPQIQSKEEKMPFAGFSDWEDCMSKQAEKYDEETAKKVCGKLKDKFEGKSPTKEEISAEMKSIVNALTAPSEDDKMAEEIKMKEEQLAVLNKAVTEKEEQIKVLQQKIATYEQEKRDAEWVSMKADLPVGMIHKEEDEKNLRKEFDEDPRAFAKRLLSMKKAEAPGKKEGVEVVDEAVEFKKINEDWKKGGGF